MTKLRHKYCKSLREMHKIVRKYLKYTTPLHMRKGSVYHKQYDQSGVYINWLDYHVIGLDALNADELLREEKNMCKVSLNGEITDVLDNLYYIRREVIDNYGKVYHFKEGDYELVGINIAFDDYYYITRSLDDNTKIKYHTCVGGLEGIEYDCTKP